ncbi:50S ribosomal protein L21e [Candidatus Woesearchaeota archaeon]|nr:50S ribosomal protein L21e [Candidatus Woesearchaeota archaeon]
MAKRIGTTRRKTRHKLSKKANRKGKISLTAYFQKFKKGDKVVLKAEPAVQKGMYHPNYYGKSGIIKGMKGRCYEISIKDQNKQKTLIVHPVHLKKT